MANTYVVEMEQGNPVEVGNLSKVAGLIGVKKVTKADIEEGKYPMVTILDAKHEDNPDQVTLGDIAEASKGHIEIIHVSDAPKIEDETAPTVEQEVTIKGEDTEDAKKQYTLDLISNAINATPESNEELFDALCELDDVVTDNLELTDKQAELLTLILTEQLDYSAPLTNKKATNTTDSESEYPEVGAFEDEKAIKKYVKGLSDESIEEWCLLEGLTWKPCEHKSINRMRMIMAIKALHFPQLAKKPGTKKPKSKYAQYSTEDLVRMALENEVEVKDDKGDPRILRMYTIMALRNAGIID